MIFKEFRINKSTGFARAAVELVRVSCKFNSVISLGYHGKTVNLNSHDSPDTILKVMILEIESESPFLISVHGMDEQNALNDITFRLRKFS
ncbi:HPr family phosphocarrier protein [Niallia circulans]|uniref:HPr family phosphocarrier protein n=1 Tax=Niallia circulans TaxID=1397 RepID=UPI00163A0862|nr:HPr family phosphocarrier protein [Niallia circulans]